jgi:hypothetical protein
MTAVDLLRVLSEERYVDTAVGKRQLVEAANCALRDFFTPEESEIEDRVFDTITVLYEQSIQFLTRITNLNHCYTEYIIVDEHGTVIVTVSRG